MERIESALIGLSVLYYAPISLIALSLVVALLLAAEFGFRIGLRRRRTLGDTDAEIGGGGVVVSSMLALLALILAFTYSSAVSRHEARKEAIVMEANALGTAFLRTDILHEPGRSELKRVLHDYALTRIPPRDYQEGRVFTLEERLDGIRATFAMQAKIWPVTRRYALAEAPNPGEVALITAINDVIDMHTVRITVLFDKLPEIVLWMLASIAASSLAVTGFIAGIHGRMSRWRMSIFATVLAAVMVVILDYDRPGTGMVLTDRTSLYVLIEDMERDLGLEGD